MKAPSITLSRAQAQTLCDFCAAHNQENYFIAKDQGAYLGAAIGDKPGQNCIFYFPDCNPEIDVDHWWDNARILFGGDDFGELLPVAELRKHLDNPRLLSIKYVVSPQEIRIFTEERKK